MPVHLPLPLTILMYITHQTSIHLRTNVLRFIDKLSLSSLDKLACYNLIDPLLMSSQYQNVVLIE